MQPVYDVSVPFAFMFFLNLNYKSTLMAQFYPTFSIARFTKSFLLSTFFLCAFYASRSQIYYANLNGPSEQPANTSPGIGKAIITIDGNTMRVQATFSGLVAATSTGAPSGTTASHIHAPTPCRAVCYLPRRRGYG